MPRVLKDSDQRGSTVVPRNTGSDFHKIIIYTEASFKDCSYLVTFGGSVASLHYSDTFLEKHYLVSV